MNIKTKNTLPFLLWIMLFAQNVSFSQNYFITLSKDTIACKQINFFDTNAQGKMIDIEYVNQNNETIRLKKKDVPEINLLCQDGAIYLRMPLKIKKTDGYYRYGKRMVKGKITVDVYDDVQTSYKLKENFNGSYNAQGVMKESREGLYMRHVRMPNGTVYEVSGLKGIKALNPSENTCLNASNTKKNIFQILNIRLVLLRKL